uniref:Aminopeptidase n=1 Tax=Ciona savignyi TaxID=51511 RepID=H2ZMG2_CIOSA
GVVFPWQRYRLPENIEPTGYHLHLHPNFTHQNFTGHVSINITIVESAEFVALHTRENKITSVTLTPINEKGKSDKASKILYCLNTEMMAIYFERKLKAWDHYTLSIHFTGNLTFSLGGFYLSKYKNEKGKETVIGTTQFEPTDARGAFPCFDEPAFKANFSLSMVRDKHLHTLFNTPLLSTKPHLGNLEMDEFQPTVKMSTYLVAFIVSDFVKISNTTSTGVEVSVYASSDKLNQLEYALHFSCEVLSYFEDLFKIPFPLPKMDLVAVLDFAAGAMENWGLVTYRETALLFDPLTSSVKDKQWVALVIAHELSHQWFGNLVTMEWWNDLWLNEGFASFMEFSGVNAVEPGWAFMSEFPLRHELRAFSADSSNFTHPISVNVSNSKEINEIFDNISYDKGKQICNKSLTSYISVFCACIISMLVDLLGDVFFQGVNKYLDTYKFSNAVNADLIQKVTIAARSSHSNIDIQAMMKTWTTLPGFPLVDVTLNEKKVSLLQSRFIYPSSNNQLSCSSVWQIPLSYVTSVDPMRPKKLLMEGKSTSFQLPQNVKWIKFNHNQTGYYKVNYDMTMWSNLIDAVLTHPETFSVSDRSSLIEDAFSAARLGKLPYNEAFRLAGYISRETMYAPIVTLINELGYVEEILKIQLEEDSRSLIHRFVQLLFKDLYTELAWKNGTSFNRNQQKLQTVVTSLMCKCWELICTMQFPVIFHIFVDWIQITLIKTLKNKRTTIQYQPSCMHKVIPSVHGPLDDWKHLWDTFVNSTDPNLKVKIIATISQTTNLDKILFLQSEFLKGENIRSQDAATLVSGLTSNLVGGPVTWRFIRQRWEEITKIHSVASFSMRSIVKNCLGLITDQGEILAAKDFFKNKGIVDMKYVQQALEKSAINAQWSKSHLPQVKVWL